MKAGWITPSSLSYRMAVRESFVLASPFSSKLKLENTGLEKEARGLPVEDLRSVGRQRLRWRVHEEDMRKKNIPIEDAQ